MLGLRQPSTLSKAFDTLEVPPTPPKIPSEATILDRYRVPSGAESDASAEVTIYELDSLGHYFAVPPHLDVEEARALQLLKDNLRDAIPVTATGSPEELIERYLWETAEGAGIVSVVKQSRTKLMYYLMKDFAGFWEIDPLVNDDGIEEISCLDGSTLVYTNPGGPVPIRELTDSGVDHHVYSLTTEKALVPVRVKEVWCSGTRPLLDVRCRGRSIECTPDHLILAVAKDENPRVKLFEHAQELKKKGLGRVRISRLLGIPPATIAEWLRGRRPDSHVYRWRWTRADKLRPGDAIAIAKGFPDFGSPFRLPKESLGPFLRRRSKKATATLLHALPSASTEELMWLLGFYIGDGFIDKRSRSGRIGFSVPISDRSWPHLEKAITNLLGLQFHRHGTDVYLYSTALRRLMTDLGLGGDVYSKHVPQWVFSLPVDQRLAFIGGYLDADGHVTDRSATIVSVNRGLLEQVKALAISCGLPVSGIYVQRNGPSVIKKTGQRISGSLGWCLRFPRQDVDRIKAKGWGPKLTEIAIHRNMYTTSGPRCLVQMTSSDLGMSKVKSIERLPPQPVYDLEVAGAHNFVANGMVVHNCTRYDRPVRVVHRRHTEYMFIETNVAYSSEDRLQAFIRRLAQFGGTTVSLAQPSLEVTLHGPSDRRVTATLGDEISRPGSTYAIRKQKESPFTIVQLASPEDPGQAVLPAKAEAEQAVSYEEDPFHKTLSALMAAYFWLLLERTTNVLVAGETSSGKTTLMNAILALMNPRAKIVTAEDVLEINLPDHLHWQRLKTRSSRAGLTPHSGRYEYTLADLLKLSLRYSPTILSLGEMRGEESETVAAAITLGFSTIATVHAENAEKCVQRLTTPPMRFSSGHVRDLTAIATMRKISLPDGRVVRRMVSVDEIQPEGSDGHNIVNIFRYDYASDSFSPTTPAEVLDRSFRLNEIAQSYGWSSTRVQMSLANRAAYITDSIRSRELTPEALASMVRRYSAKESRQELARLGV